MNFFKKNFPLLKDFDIKGGRPLQDQHKILLAHALKVKEIYAKTHYTFIHGQKLSLWVINQFIKEVTKLLNPDKDLSLYHFFRCRKGTGKTIIQKILKKFDQNSFLDDKDDFMRKNLLSVDAYFFNLATGESANTYVNINKNEYLNSVPLGAENAILKEILAYYLGADNLQIRQKLMKLCKEYGSLDQIGNIYAICVPREDFTNYAYASHPYGRPCKCVDHSKHTEILNHLQNDTPVLFNEVCDQIFKISYKPKPNDPDLFPQFRVATRALNPEKCRVFLLTPIAKDIKDAFKVKIQAIAKTVVANH